MSDAEAEAEPWRARRKRKPRAKKPLSIRLADGLCPDPSTGCVVWTKSVNPLGYGALKDGSKHVAVHRLAYELAKGTIPAGLVIDHLCRNRRCCNPDHLEPVTQFENIMRGVGVTARRAQATHCKRGHPFDESNTRIRAGGHRACIPCEQERYARQPRLTNRRVRSPTCIHGHPWDEANTIITSRGQRECRACHCNRNQALRKRKVLNV